MEKIKKFLNRETISYLIVGILTTAVDYIVFAIINETLRATDVDRGIAVTIATVLSWFAAVLFSYIANKLFVFKNYDFGFLHCLKECGSFFVARLLSGGIVLVLMWILTGVFLVNEYIAKVMTSIFNIVFNYVAAKLFIFKKS